MSIKRSVINEIKCMNLHTYMPLWLHCDPPQRRYKAPGNPLNQRCTWSPRLRKRPDQSPPLCVALKENKIITSIIITGKIPEQNGSILVLGQKPGSGNVENPDGSGAEAAGEGLLVWMKRHGARLVLRRKIVQLKRQKSSFSSAAPTPPLWLDLEF